MAPMIEVRGLSMRLTSGGRPVSVLDGVSLSIPARQFVAISGPSGSGKSTLLGLIAGLAVVRPVDVPAGTRRLAGSVRTLSQRMEHVERVAQVPGARRATTATP